MGNRLPSGTKKNTIVPSTNSIDCPDIHQLKGKNEPQRHTISERSDQKEYNENQLFTSNNIDISNTPTSMIDGSIPSQRGIPSNHSSKNSSKNNSSRRSSSRSRVNLSTRTPALSFKQHPSSIISIESSEDIVSHQSYLNNGQSLDTTRSLRAQLMEDLVSSQRNPLDMDSTDVDVSGDEMMHKRSFRTDLTTSSSARHSKTDLISQIHSTVNTARRDVITGIITIPASSLSSQNINMALDNMISGLLSGTNSAECSPRNSFGPIPIIHSAKESPKRPTALPAYLYAINDNSDHDVDGVLKNMDDAEGDYCVGGNLSAKLFE